uniref:Integrin_alpha2 domain-containing protein n=1 Tax=Heterorhabditis bacteriophora TaxID=37862 RepID=A0A1I7WJK2_HETBA
MTGQDSNCIFLECKMTNKFDYNISPFEIYITVSIATPLLDGQIQKVGTTISLTLSSVNHIFLISLFNVLCAFIYVYMQYFPPSKCDLLFIMFKLDVNVLMVILKENR